MIKILHYAPNVGKGSLLEAYITDLVHGTQDVAEVRVAYNYAEAQKQLKASKPDIVHLHACWNWATVRLAQTARQHGCAIVLSPHWQLETYTTHNERYISKRVKKTIYQQRVTQNADALLVSSEREREHLLHDQWQDRIEVVKATPLTTAVSTEAMGQQAMAFYHKVGDTRYELLMTDDEHEAIRSLLHVGMAQDLTHQLLNSEQILNLRTIKPQQWRRIMLLADDESIRHILDRGIQIMQLDVPTIDAAAINRFPKRHQKEKGSLPGEKLILTNPLTKNKIRDVLNDLPQTLRQIIIMLVNTQALLKRRGLTLRHVAELYEAIKYDDYNETEFAAAVKQLHLYRFARRITQVLHNLVYLEEGFYPVPALNDRKVKQLQKTILK